MSHPRAHMPRSNSGAKVTDSLSQANSGADLIQQLPRYNLRILAFLCHAVPGYSLSHSEELRAAYYTPRGRGII